jgi:hypothetical protein
MLGLESAFDLAGPKHLADVYRLRKTLEGVPPEIAIIEERTYEPPVRNTHEVEMGRPIEDTAASAVV